MTSNYLGEDLIFIVSQPRSGSTLLQRVLSGHPDVQSSAETWLMLHPMYGLRDRGIQTEYSSKWARAGTREFLSYYTDGPDLYDDAIRAWAKVIYGNALQRSGKRVFLDKTPRYYFIVPDLLRVFPNARFIFLIRNPMAVLASELSTYIKGNWRTLSDFRVDLVDAPALILDGIERAGRRAIRVQYESFVADPEGQLESLCGHLGISHHPEMLEYSRTPPPKGRMADPVGIHRHTRPSTDSLERWKEMSGDPQARHFLQAYLQALGPETIERMGYSFQSIADALADPHDAKLGEFLFPWELAIQPEASWTLRERMLIKRLEALQKKGPFRGSLSTVRAGTKLIWQTVREELSSRVG
jgi:hypothetical protein